MRKRISKKFTMPEIVLTPLIDVALTLVVILMVVAPVVRNGIKVDLPQGQSKEVGSQQELVISMAKDNKIFFNSYPVERTALAAEVVKAMKGNKEVPVYIHADQNIPYGTVVAVLDDLKVAGVNYVGMSTRSTNASQTPAPAA
jgi:biopolymer transport protein TolR